MNRTGKNIISDWLGIQEDFLHQLNVFHVLKLLQTHQLDQSSEINEKVLTHH